MTLSLLLLSNFGYTYLDRLNTNTSIDRLLRTGVEEKPHEERTRNRKPKCRLVQEATGELPEADTTHVKIFGQEKSIENSKNYSCLLYL